MNRLVISFDVPAKKHGGTASFLKGEPKKKLQLSLRKSLDAKRQKYMYTQPQKQSRKFDCMELKSSEHGQAQSLRDLQLKEA
ncbi:hypothetical protein O6P43_027464 [Quillaja saponaria]|uniref:Uncharacterized protein n=1 Tax=Quillaja saponaria TaxID=32244 RepID=A0AAD7L523_QUISA|nr:hypothetical protein O6P43_027464 [Quillaja saponaria]